MAVLLVGIGIMSVMLTVAMPVWRQMQQREKEEELIFRGNQYARAIGLFMRKYPNAYPSNLDVLVQQKFLRKKYKDPMVADGQFQLVPAAATGRAGQVAGMQTGLIVQQPGSSSSGRSGAAASSSTSGLTFIGPFSGVVSKSTDKSIRLYNGKDHYNEWTFLYAGPGGRGGFGGRGRQGGPGGRGDGGRGQGGRGRNPQGMGIGGSDQMQIPQGMRGGRGPGGGGRGPGGQ